MALFRRGAIIGVVLLIACAPPSSAASVQHRGISFTLPSGWAAKDHAQVRNEIAARPANAEPDAVASVWQFERDDGTLSKITLGSSPLPTSVTRHGIHSVRRWIASGLGGSADVQDVAIQAITATEVDGVPAYRIHLRLKSRGDCVEQLQVVVAAARTYALGFSCPADGYEEMEDSFESVIDSVTVADRPSVLRRSSFWLWNGLGGGVLSLGLAFRRRGHRRRGGEDGVITADTAP